MIDNKRILAIIPASGESERMPRKKILNLVVKLLISRSIEAALVFKYINRVIVPIDDEEITFIKENPVYSFFVNAGIYLLKPECIDLIPKDMFYDMPTLFEQLMSNNEKITSFPLKEYWLDIGKLEDFKKANLDYRTAF
jgi:NDP-sugar pyrophosphorylase family protein